MVCCRWFSGWVMDSVSSRLNRVSIISVMFSVLSG